MSKTPAYTLLSRHRGELMGLAMLAIIAFHLNMVVLPAPLDRLRSLGFGGVDMFILLSGMGLAWSQCKREQEYGAFLRRRAQRILPAYYLVMVPFTVYLIVQGRATLSTLIWNSSLLYYWVNTAGKFNWYIAGIALFYVLTPPLVALLRRQKRREPLVLALVALGVAVSMILIHDHDFIHLDIPYRIPVFAQGLLLGLYLAEDKPFTWRDGLFWLAVLGLGMVFLQVYQGFPVYVPLCFLFIFTTVPVCLGASWLLALLPRSPLHVLLGAIGEASLEIYLLNVTLFAEHSLLQPLLDLGPRHRAYGAFSLVLNVSLGLLLHRLLNRKKPQ